MKKIILGISVISATLLFASESTYTQFLDTAVEDIYDIHNYSKTKMSEIAQSDKVLQEYNNKLNKYETDVSLFLKENNTNSFTSKDDANKALDELDKLSIENVQLAKTVAYLASHHADNVSENYNTTLKETSKTILRLSDDIGVMADRILLMAKEIGIMADRILKTQEIQSQNLAATQKLTHYAMTLTDAQVTATRENVHNSMNTGMSNMNMNTNQIQSQQSLQTTIPMH
ncbi:hypothetical protein MNB_SM-6-641 [hydrothermal vent metagenome]|uniref:Uncharacterized protein n=1 Tax=hydrothermal vent metagenome TaxID=652676 RepID=A0A1W1CA61_9ZZZZ